METKMLMMMIITILASLHLRIQWLTIGAVFLTILLYISENKPAPKPSSGGAPGAPQDVLRPVIYRDVGQPPLLYPKDQKVEVFKRGGPKSGIQMITESIGNALGLGFVVIDSLFRRK